MVQVPRHKLRRGRYPLQKICVVCRGWEGGISWYLYHIPAWKLWEKENTTEVQKYIDAVS